MRHLPVLYLIIRRPTTSTIFPYTTLFRSVHLRRAVPQDRRADRALGDPERGLRPARPVRQSAVGDRKSTRLNSSHSQISYAVFCLKKKSASDIKRDDSVVHLRLRDRLKCQ